MQTQDNGNAAENGEQTPEMMDNGQHSTAPAASPDSKRPTAKTSDDYSNLSPIAMMAHGYNLR